MKARAALAFVGIVAWSASACAQSFEFDGFLDARVVAAPSEKSWTEGGLGPTRYGGGGVDARFASAALVGSAVLTPDITAFADVQVHTTDQAEVNLIESYLRYRPVSMLPIRFAIKAGVFFPPISLENDGLGWTSPWTLTPSAIDSWVGEELRVIGTEARVEWRGWPDTFEAAVAVFGANDPAGAILADRGWSLSDLTYGIGAQLREPNLNGGYDNTTPIRYNPFQQIGARPGYYGELTWKSVEYGRFTVLHYDSNANPSDSTGDDDSNEIYAWHTQFWSFGGKKDFGQFVLIGQAMTGSTEVAPDSDYLSKTDFQAAYLLAGWNQGDWRPTIRVDTFATEQRPLSAWYNNSEHGNALTAALNWRPRDWCRITGEVMRVSSWRPERVRDDVSAQTTDVQSQLSLRLYF